MEESLILASSSPRRRDLLLQAGIPFEVKVPETDETCTLPAVEAVVELSRRKALACAKEYQGRFVLGADTLVVLDGVKLGKPRDTEDACRMLRLLSGRTHQVCTGVTVISPSGTLFSGVDSTDVTFEEIPDEEIRSYVLSGEPMDKAGAYALQGRAGMWVSRLDGSDTSVIGLPLYLVRRLLIDAGYPLLQEMAQKH